VSVPEPEEAPESDGGAAAPLLEVPKALPSLLRSCCSLRCFNAEKEIPVSVPGWLLCTAFLLLVAVELEVATSTKNTIPMIVINVILDDDDDKVFISIVVVVVVVVVCCCSASFLFCDVDNCAQWKDF